MSTNDPSEPSSFEPPKPHELAPHPAPAAPSPSEAAESAEAAAEARSDAADADAAAESAVPVEPAPLASEPVTAVTSAVETTATQPVVTPEPTAVTPVTPVVVAAAAEPPKQAKRKHGPVRVLSILVMVSGVILIAAGVVTWFVVRDQLSNEKITVSDDASHFAGNAVDSPWTAYAQADAINKHALAASGGLTYAQLPQDDPKRDTVMTASFLRASLYTSVVSFGVAAFAAGIGLILILVGWSLHRVDRALRRL